MRLDATDNEGWLIRRCEALEKLLVCHRIDRPPSEGLFRELDITKRAFNRIITDRNAACRLDQDDA